MDMKTFEGGGSRERDSDASRSAAGRNRLAGLVVLGSFLTIFLLVAALLAVARGDDPAITNIAQNTFNTILPVLAGWVGTVLAFYFSAQSLERTSSSLDRVINQQGLGGTVAQAPVSEKMIPLKSIRSLYDLGDKKPAAIQLDELRKKFTGVDEGGAVSRLVFVDNGVFRYVLHGSTLNGYLVSNPLDGAAASPPTFEQLLNDKDSLYQISKLVVFVPVTATLAEAKAALEAMPGAQDIIVTKNGKANEPMLGWITNVDLSKALTVN